VPVAASYWQLAPEGQTLPQAPQLLLSDRGSMQKLEHKAAPGGQPQVPLWQNWLLGQT
jgi:hypothetical protein